MTGNWFTGGFLVGMGCAGNKGEHGIGGGSGASGDGGCGGGSGGCGGGCGGGS